MRMTRWSGRSDAARPSAIAKIASAEVRLISNDRVRIDKGADYTQRFKAAWQQFAADEANLTMFLAAKRRARRTRNPP
jgi:hypothetical protein